MRAIAFVLVIFSATACANRPGAVDRSPTPAATRFDHAITRQDIARARLDDRSTYDAIKHLAPLLLSVRLAGPTSPGLLVFIDGSRFDLDVLGDVPARTIESVERVTPGEAAVRFGYDAAMCDVLVVTTRHDGR